MDHGDDDFTMTYTRVQYDGKIYFFTIRLSIFLTGSRAGAVTQIPTNAHSLVLGHPSPLHHFPAAPSHRSQ